MLSSGRRAGFIPRPRSSSSLPEVIPLRMFHPEQGTQPRFRRPCEPARLLDRRSRCACFMPAGCPTPSSAPASAGTSWLVYATKARRRGRPPSAGARSRPSVRNSPTAKPCSRSAAAGDRSPCGSRAPFHTARSPPCRTRGHRRPVALTLRAGNAAGASSSCLAPNGGAGTAATSGSSRTTCCRKLDSPIRFDVPLSTRGLC